MASINANGNNCKYKKQASSRVWIDAYDNYESSISWAKPLHLLWRRAIKRADLVTVAGSSLKNLFVDHDCESEPVVIPMAVDPDGVEPLNCKRCRTDLRLPRDRVFIGYPGAISHTRGIDQLFSATEEARGIDERIVLILSGRLDKSVNLPHHAIYLGHIPAEQLTKLYNALDMLVVMNIPGTFGNNSFPIKLYEAMACRVAVAAIATKSTREILQHFPDRLVEFGDHNSMKRLILEERSKIAVNYPRTPTWDESGDTLVNLLT